MELTKDRPKAGFGTNGVERSVYTTRQAVSQLLRTALFLKVPPAALPYDGGL
jgi:hypothetical protein